MYKETSLLEIVAGYMGRVIKYFKIIEVQEIIKQELEFSYTLK